jgi:hypothetical protein
MPRILLFASFVALTFAGDPCAAGESPQPKVLVEFGWDEPDTAFLKKHISVMQRSPFDGCVFHANGRAKDGETLNLTWRFWSRRAFTPEEFAAPKSDLATTDFGRFRHNFLRVNVTPGDVDWFDDFQTVLGNARLAAGLAREGRCAGVLLDTEAYEKNLFHYPSRVRARSRSWDEYAAQARLRGREVMESFQNGYPGLTVMLTFGPSAIRHEVARSRKPEKETDSGLLGPFVDGMADAVRDGSTIIDGYELSYGYREAKQFGDALKSIRQCSPKLQAGFGLWLDYDWRKHGWQVADPSRNHFSPEAFETSVRAALERSDAVVWIYSETPRWWTDDGETRALPAVYDQALRRAKAPAR